MKMMKTLILAAAVLAGFAGKAATPETATGSSAYFHVCTSNETVKITDVYCKYFEGEYGKGKGRNIVLPTSPWRDWRMIGCCTRSWMREATGSSSRSTACSS